MAKSPKNEQGNGKKFQVRQPGEKRNRKIDFAKTEPKKTKMMKPLLYLHHHFIKS